MHGLSDINECPTFCSRLLMYSAIMYVLGWNEASSRCWRFSPPDSHPPAVDDTGGNNSNANDINTY